MSRNEFVWVYTEQSHVSRRKVILGECLAIAMGCISKPLQKPSKQLTACWRLLECLMHLALFYLQKNIQKLRN